LRTGKSYVGWIKRYIWHHGKRYSLEIAVAEGGFLSHLVVSRNVSASMQNQAKAPTLARSVDPAVLTSLDGSMWLKDVNLVWREIFIVPTRWRVGTMG
jgi:hypothetical protein